MKNQTGYWASCGSPNNRRLSPLLQEDLAQTVAAFDLPALRDFR